MLRLPSPDTSRRPSADHRRSRRQRQPWEYSQDDSTPPSLLVRQVSTRVNVPNCKTAAPVSGFVAARFDNVFVNQSALP
jgi:hypothetical protein